MGWIIRTCSRTRGRIRSCYILQSLHVYDLSEHLECDNRLIGRLYRAINIKELHPVTIFTHYFMAGVVNHTGSSMLSWKKQTCEKHMTYAQEKWSRFVTWPTALLLIVNVLGSNAANFSFPYQSMAWTVALPPSQLQLGRIWRLRLCVWCQWGYTHLMSASPAWEIPCKSVLLEQIAWPTQIRVRNLESTRLWSCLKPDLASCAGFNADYKWKQWEKSHRQSR